MLPNHSVLKVVENFRMLEVLFPNRIGLGIGRAPGTDWITSSILNPSNDFSEASYLQQLEYMRHFFRDILATKQGSLLAMPQSTTIPSQWTLITANYGMVQTIGKRICVKAYYINLLI